MPRSPSARDYPPPTRANPRQTRAATRRRFTPSPAARPSSPFRGDRQGTKVHPSSWWMIWSPSRVAWVPWSSSPDRKLRPPRSGMLQGGLQCHPDLFVAPIHQDVLIGVVCWYPGILIFCSLSLAERRTSARPHFAVCTAACEGAPGCGSRAIVTIARGLELMLKPHPTAADTAIMTPCRTISHLK